jgi:hypothetical protein
LVGFFGAIGAGVGAWIDAAIKDRTTVYQALGQRSSSFQLSPFFLKSGAGIQMSMRFWPVVCTSLSEAGNA